MSSEPNHSCGQVTLQDSGGQLAAAGVDAAHAAWLRAGEAMLRAQQLWPGGVSEVLCEHIALTHGHLHWLGPSARTRRLITEILAAPREEEGDRDRAADRAEL